MRGQHRLSTKKVAALAKVPGRHLDGGGLLLQVSKDGKRASWILRYSIKGRRRDQGLGAVPAVTLADARRAAAESRASVAKGIDPIESKKAPQGGTAAGYTLLQAATEYQDAKKHEWTSPRYTRQWLVLLRNHVGALLDKPIADITLEDVLAALRPIWHEKPTAACRVRAQLEMVFDAAAARGLVPPDAPNPAAWTRLRHWLAKRPVAQHQRSLPWRDTSAFMAELATIDLVSAYAARFTILTAVRVGEAVGAEWSEIDLEGATWSVPSDRMKMRRPHRVALSVEALEILRLMRSMRVGAHVFPGQSGHIGTSALTELRRRMGRTDITWHGFRATFATWAADHEWPRDLVEHALAHQVGSAVEVAYQRSDLLERRRPLMEAWSVHCTAHV